MALIYGNEIQQIIDELKQLNDQLNDQTKDLLKKLEDLLEYENRAEAIRIRHLGRDITDNEIRSLFEKEKLRKKS